MSSQLKIYPEDLGKEYGTLAIKLPMNNSRADTSGGIFNMSHTTEEQAVSNYINLLLTKPGERFMQPTFGVGLHWYLFEQNTEASRGFLEERIKQQAARWLPYIINMKIDIVGGDGQFRENFELDHSYNIIIHFKVTESGANRVVSFFTEGDRVGYNLQ